MTVDYGTDFLLLQDNAGNRDLAVTSGGDAALVAGGACVIQDVTTRLITPLGSLFYDEDFGSRLLEYLHKPVDDLLLLGVEQEVETCLESEPRIQQHTVIVKAACGQNPDEVFVKASFKLIGEDTVRNLVVQLAGSTVKVLEDYRP